MYEYILAFYAHSEQKAVAQCNTVFMSRTKNTVRYFALMTC